MEVFIGLVLGNYVEELLLLAVEGGGEPVGQGAADAVAGMATVYTVFEEDALPPEGKSRRSPPISCRGSPQNGVPSFFVPAGGPGAVAQAGGRMFFSAMSDYFCIFAFQILII